MVDLVKPLYTVTKTETSRRENKGRYLEYKDAKQAVKTIQCHKKNEKGKHVNISINP